MPDRRPFGRTHWSERVLLISVSALTLAQLRTPINVYDEGLVLTAGLRILAREVPYLDFWRVYPPGQFLLAAGVDLLGGHTLLAQRLVDVLFRIGIIVVTWSIALRLMNASARALLIIGVGVAMAAVNSHFLYPVYPSFLLVLVCFLNALRATEVDNARWRLSAAAASLVLAALFRLDVAAYGGVSLLLAGLWGHWRGVSPELSKRLLQIVAVAGASGLILGVGLLFWVTPQAAWECLVVFPATGMRAARGLPLPPWWEASLSPMSSWVAWYSLVALLTFAVFAVIESVRAARDATLALRVAMLGFCLGLALLAISRPDRSHALPSLLMGLMVVLACRAATRVRALKAVSLVAAASVVVLQFSVALRTIIPDLQSYPLWAPCQTIPARASCVAIASDQAAAVNYVQSVTGREERIFVGNDRHDRVYIGDSIFYYLANRLPATRYDELHPGVSDQARVQAEVIEQLRSVRYIVLWDAPESGEPNASSATDGSTLLDDYIRTHFRTTHTVGNYRILLRDTLPR